MNMPPKGTSKEKSGKTSYRSKQPGRNGLIRYTQEENATWHDLITRQVPMLHGRACPQWIAALDEMNFPTDRIPQLGEVSEVLRKHTGWSVMPRVISVPPGLTRVKACSIDSFTPAASITTSNCCSFTSEGCSFLMVVLATPSSMPTSMTSPIALEPETRFLVYNRNAQSCTEGR